MAPEALEATGANYPFAPDPIPVEINGGSYVGPTLLGPLADLLAGLRLAGSGGGVRSGICGSGNGGISGGWGGGLDGGTALK